MLKTCLKNKNNKDGFASMEAIISCAILTISIISFFLISEQARISHRRNRDLYNNFYSNKENNRQKIKDQIYNFDFENEFGRETCNNNQIVSSLEEIYFLNITGLTDIEVEDNFLYFSRDTAIQNDSDLYIYNILDPYNPKEMSSIDTGPGIRAISKSLDKIYSANTSQASQMQIIDIKNRAGPLVLSKIKLNIPLGFPATTTMPISRSIFYNKNKIYLGTEKWEGSEFNIIDVSNSNNPIIIGEKEIGALVSSIYVSTSTIFLTSASSTAQLVQYSLGHLDSIPNIFNAEGDYQDGKAITQYSDMTFLGRTVGGFNSTKNMELFVLGKNNEILIQADIASSVYRILPLINQVLLISSDISKSLQIWFMSLLDSSLNLQKTFSIGSKVLSFRCHSMPWGQNFLFIIAENGLHIFKIL